MRKLNKVLLIVSAASFALGVGAAVTFAVSYNAPTESTTYQFGSMVASDHNFQELGYYFADGAGTEGDPYIIKNSHQLRNLSKLQNSGALPAATYVSLGTSFQYEGDDLEPIGTSTYPFTGVFNGSNFAITGLKVSTSTLTNVGMFGVVGTNTATGTVQNLVLAGPSISYTGSSTVKIGIVAGSKNTTTGHVSVVQNIEIYGGNSNFTNMRAHIHLGGSTTTGNGIVGNGGSSTSGFVSALNPTPTYSSTATTSSVRSANDYYIYHNGTDIVVSNS